MTIRKIFELAALRIMINEEHIADIRKRIQEKPDLSEFKLRQDFFDLMLTMVMKENEFIMRIIKEIPEPHLKKIVKDVIREYDDIKDSEKAVKRTRKKSIDKRTAGGS